MLAVSLILFNVRLVAAECVLDSTGATFSGIDSSTNKIASLSVTCDSEYKIAFDAGNWASGSRRLQDGKGNFITYRLWQDSSAAQEWGDNGFSSATYAAPPLSAAAGS
ncbi:MAG: hypothetical protein D3915_15755, partial [Candidatus Electrothrix sp. AU1_5]|nr:hypothetical protein [Candidatus Electrothrix gigas]